MLWTCVSLMISDVEHLFRNLSAVCISPVSFGEMSVRVVCPFFNWVIPRFATESYEFFIYLGFNPLSDGWFTNRSPHPGGRLFVSWTALLCGSFSA